MTKRLFFFATGRDLAAIFGVAESKKALQYTPAGRFDEVSPHLIENFKDLPNIGVATFASSIACDGYLISEAGLQISARRLPSAPFFAFDQLVNPKTVLFTGAGMWKNEILLGGSITTASNDPISIELMKLFRRIFKKSCEVVKNNYVGTEAGQLWRQGMRLTFAEHSPRMYDLTS